METKLINFGSKSTEMLTKPKYVENGNKTNNYKNENETSKIVRFSV